MTVHVPGPQTRARKRNRRAAVVVAALLAWGLLAVAYAVVQGIRIAERLEEEARDR